MSCLLSEFWGCNILVRRILNNAVTTFLLVYFFSAFHLCYFGLISLICMIINVCYILLILNDDVLQPNDRLDNFIIIIVSHLRINVVKLVNQQLVKQKVLNPSWAEINNSGSSTVAKNLEIPKNISRLEMIISAKDKLEEGLKYRLLALALCTNHFMLCPNYSINSSATQLGLWRSVNSNKSYVSFRENLITYKFVYIVRKSVLLLIFIFLFRVQTLRHNDGKNYPLENSKK